MIAITQHRIISVDEDLSKGSEQLNKYIRQLQLVDKVEILDIKRNGNVYDLTIHITPDSPEPQVQKEVQEVVESAI